MAGIPPAKAFANDSIPYRVGEGRIAQSRRRRGDIARPKGHRQTKLGWAPLRSRGMARLRGCIEAGLSWRITISSARPSLHFCSRRVPKRLMGEHRCACRCFLRYAQNHAFTRM
jgi:hypothetical protein